jgi:DNA modification methylase
MQAIVAKISDVKVNPNNPRLIKDDKFAKLVQSIKDLPQMLAIRPIVVNTDMVVLGGNMRLKACKEAGLKEVPIIIADNLTEEQQREFLIKDNVSGGEWDWQMLANDWYSDRKQTTVIEFDRPSRNGEHPTMKPIGLFAYQIENSSKQGDIVIDAFGGSGTTMVACEQLKRKARVIEFDPKYCQVIVDRMLKLDPSLKVKRNGIEYITS